MKLLYIFPHPDDESFGPAPSISHYRRQGHEVHLLTLTRGEATKMREKLGVSKAEMGEIRFQEMQAVAKVLDLSSLTVWDFPDGELKELDPRELEHAIATYARKLSPDIVVTYPAHGISGFLDHLVTHAVVKRVYLELRDEGLPLRRLAFFTLRPDANSPGGSHRLTKTRPQDIDCLVRTDDTDHDQFIAALGCYETYREVIEESGVKNVVDDLSAFEIFGEDFDPPLAELTDRLPESLPA